jgi:hypothetical protein
VFAWDHRDAYAHILGNAAQGQQAEGGHNRDNNCVPTTGCDIARAYGGPDLNPQDLTTAAYGAGWHGGEAYEPMVAALRARWSGCPPVTYSNPPDTLAGVDAEAMQGHAVGCSLHCDGWGTISTRVTGILHVCTLVAHIDGHVHVMNSERNNLVILSEAEFAAATSGQAGQLLHFQRPLPALQQGGDDLTAAQLLNIKRGYIWQERLHHENWPSDPNAQENDIDVFARQINDDLDFEPVTTALHQMFETNHQPTLFELLAAVRAKVGGA